MTQIFRAGLKVKVSIRSLQFEGIDIGAISLKHGQAEILIDHAIIVKDMDGAERDTRWHGKGRFTINQLREYPSQLPEFPITLTGADIKNNQMTFRGEISIPFEFYGNVGIILHFPGDQPSLSFFGEHMTFDLTGHEKYIEHIY